MKLARCATHNAPIQIPHPSLLACAAHATGFYRSAAPISLSARDLGRSPLAGNFPRVFGHPPCRPRHASLRARATPRCRVVQTSLGRARVLALLVGTAVAHAAVRLLRICFRRGVGLVVLSCYVAHRARLVCVMCVGDAHARRYAVLWWPLGHQGSEKTQQTHIPFP